MSDLLRWDEELNERKRYAVTTDNKERERVREKREREVEEKELG